MPLLYAIDRFEDREWVVLEDESARTFRVPRSWVPADAREGQVLAVDTEESASANALRIVVDSDATTKRQQQVQQLRSSLQRGPKGDLSL
jgi:hypothetical protein